MRAIDADKLMEQVKYIHQAVDTSEVNIAHHTGFHSATSQLQGLIACMPTVEVPRWIPVTERLPEKGGEYLCYCCIDGHIEYPFFMVLRYYLVDENPHFQHECGHGLNVTHWMPLPQPPKDCEYCKFYGNECEAHSQMETIGQKRGMEICELFFPDDAPKDGDT